jgi:hypothetical protein
MKHIELKLELTEDERYQIIKFISRSKCDLFKGLTVRGTDDETYQMQDAILKALRAIRDAG